MYDSVTVTELAERRILVLDGAMGTMIQSFHLGEADYRFEERPASVGCNEVLNLTRSDLIADIHLSYLRSGADIIETNSFGANAFSLAEYALADLAYDINLAAAEIARSAVESYAIEEPSRPTYVAGVLGPTGKSASLSPSVDDPAFREVTFADFVTIYRQQVEALMDGGVDLLLIETVFDTLVAKAAVVAANEVFRSKGRELPIMVSVTFSDKSGRTLSGQTIEAFLDTLSPFPLFSVGLNCSTGPEEMIPLIERLSRRCDCRTSAHPNAGFPDRDGNYTQSPERLAALMEPVVARGMLNIIGGCCGTTPAHIERLSEVARKWTPRAPRERTEGLRLAGLEPLAIPSPGELIAVGERANVAGSKKFARLIREGAYDKALAIARTQVAQGASMIDICMDDPLIDATEAMVRFIRLASADPEIAKVPFMIDSSDWSVVECALRELQGRGIVNSISLKEGPEPFLQKARHIASMGAAMVVMLFDEQGQADTFERKIDVALRAYELLVEGGVCDAGSVVFDPNVLAIATGIDEHDRYASDFIRATAWIKHHLPGVSISGGVSNLSFSFRGNNSLREAMHAIFLSYAVDSGLDMAIINPGTRVDPTTIPAYAADLLEQVLLAKGDMVSHREALIAMAAQPLELAGAGSGIKASADLSWRTLSVPQRLAHALLVGEDSYLAGDLEELASLEAVQIIEGPLMEGMSQVGKLFGEGKLFLPQVVRSARVMKRAVDILQPRLATASAGAKTAGTIILATVKGDVHDIGKNIVALVLRCNNFKIVDLGVMVPPADILHAVREERADIVALSGLITPSLTEMGAVCVLLREEGLEIPVMVGGATTSEEHTALKLDPLYPGNVFHSTDASDAVSVALKLLGRDRDLFKKEIGNRYLQYRKKSNGDDACTALLTLAEAEALPFCKIASAPIPMEPGIHTVSDIPFEAVAALVNWPMLCRAWRVPTGTEEAVRLVEEAKSLLHEDGIRNLFRTSMKAVIGLFPARSDGKQVVHIDTGSTHPVAFRFLRAQQPGHDGRCRSLADYVHPTEADAMGLFVATAGLGVAGQVAQYNGKDDSYHALLLQTIADRMAEALSQYLHHRLAKQWWGFGEIDSIRPASGYPSAPDHTQKETIFSVLDATRRIGVRLTEGYAMDPVSSVCGFYFVGEGCSYFSLGKLGHDQLADYAAWRGVDLHTLERTLATQVQSFEEEQ